MTENELYEEYCNEYPLIMGYREVSYKSWLQRQVLELHENVVNKNCNTPRVSQRSELLAFKRFVSKTPLAELELYSDEEFTDLYLKANCG